MAPRAARVSSPPAERCREAGWRGAVQDAGGALAAAALSALMALGGGGAAGAVEETTFQFPASPDPERRTAQETLVEAYAYTKAYFVDPDMNGLDWDKELQGSLAATFKAADVDSAYEVSRELVGKLGDQFTRLLSPADASKFLNAEKGQINAIGMQVARELDLSVSTGGRRVTAVIADSAAERAGVQPGDVLLAINSKSLRLYEADRVGALLRAPEGVDVLLLHADGTELRAHLQAEGVKVNPVQFGLVPYEGGSAGYVKLAVFSENAPAKVEEAVRALQAGGASAFILDLRDNAGGGILPGYQTAALWLRPGEGLTNVEYPRGSYTEKVAIQDFTKPITDAPLVVLVNGRTASVSELLAGALHDDGRAQLIGETTFGKGRSQRVIQLKSGWLLLVSTNLFTTPLGNVIDKVGIAPDVVCKPTSEVQEMWRPGPQESADLLQDPCIARAASSLSQRPAR